MERSHRQLRTRLTNRLCGNNTNSFTHIHRRSACKVTTVTMGANTVTCFTGQNRSNFDTNKICRVNRIGMLFEDHLAFFDDNFTGNRINNIIRRNTAKNTFRQRCDHFTCINYSRNSQSFGCTAIIFRNDAILCNINKTTGQITGVSSFQSCISKAFTGPVSGVEVFQNRKTFFKI